MPLSPDITKPAQVPAAVQAAGDVQVLINNAGVNHNAGQFHAVSLCASKAAGLSMAQGVRAELGKSGTRVVAVMPGAVDTRMTAGVDVPKMQPAEIARAVLDALAAGHGDIYPGGMAAGLAADPKAVEKQCAAYLPRQ